MTRLEQARAEIARRRALAEAATPGTWTTSKAPCIVYRSGDLIAVVHDSDIQTGDAAYIAANDPAHVLPVLAAADATLDRHARTHTCQSRWLDDGQAAGDGAYGRYIWPYLVCPDAAAVLDLYAPRAAHGA